jgi:pyridoxine kinase
MKDMIKMFRRENTVVFVDPVMGDRGRLYSGFDAAFPAHMASLAAMADVISPNLTEASLMLGCDYRETDDRDALLDMLKRLTDGGAASAVITGIVTADGKRQGAVSYDSRSGESREYFLENIKAGPLHGSGDVFSSVMAGGLTLGLSLGDAMSLAADFTVECIRATAPIAAQHSYGVMFERSLYKLHDMIEVLISPKNC